MPKKHNNSKKMPIYIPNQPRDWMWGVDGKLIKEMKKENEFQKKLGLRNK